MEKEIVITLIVGAVGIFCTIIACIIPSLMQAYVGKWKRDAAVASRCLEFMLAVEAKLREELSAEKAKNDENAETPNVIKTRVRNELYKDTDFKFREALEPARVEKLVAKYKL